MIGKFKVDHKKIFSNRLKHLRRETEKYINFLQIETPWRVINKDTTPAPLTLREIEFLLKEFTDSNMEDVMYYNSLIKIKKDKLRAQGFATDY